MPDFDDPRGGLPVHQQIVALHPVLPPTGEAACARWQPAGFSTARRQQAIYDGEISEAAGLAAARALCAGCPMLVACRRYAEDSCDDVTFLAGTTGEERAARRRKSQKIALRRRQGTALRRAGVPTKAIAALLGVHVTLVRADLRIVELEVAA